MSVDVFYLSYPEGTPKRGYWDTHVLDKIFSNSFAQSNIRHNFEIHEVSEIPDNLEFAVVVFPARAQLDYVDVLDQELNKLESVVLFIVGDEEGQFPVAQLSHPSMIIYVMSAFESHEGVKPFINGYPPQLEDYRPKTIKKTSNFFFSGQITHERRKAFYNQLKKRDDGVLISTKGFTQGLGYEEYYKEMARAKVAPCPSGPQTPDTFRLYEALEFGCVPIVDYRTPSGKSSYDYWTHMFGGVPPFPVLREDSELNDLIDEVVADYEAMSLKVGLWWHDYKWKLVNEIYSDITKLKETI